MICTYTHDFCRLLSRLSKHAWRFGNISEAPLGVIGIQLDINEVTSYGDTGYFGENYWDTGY